MSIIQSDENGISHCYCSGDHWILVHDNEDVFIAQQHKGRTSTGADKTIEYFDTELDMETRIVQLGLNPLPEVE